VRAVFLSGLAHEGQGPVDRLGRRGPGESREPVQGADGLKRTRSRHQEREIETVFGTVSVERTGYGREGADSLHPLDAELNLPADRHSLEPRRRVADEAAQSSFDETRAAIAREHRRPCPQEADRGACKKGGRGF